MENIWNPAYLGRIFTLQTTTNMQHPFNTPDTHTAIVAFVKFEFRNELPMYLTAAQYEALNSEEKAFYNFVG